MLNSLTVNRFKLGTVIFLSMVALLGAIYFAVNLLKPKVARIYVETSPSSAVYLNDVHVGQTPFRDNVKPGEYELKLIPELTEDESVSYTTKILLADGVETVIRREFGKFEETSGGEIISFEKIARDEVSLVIITTPDSAQLLIDQRDRAFTPHKTSAISAGEHTLSLSANGYQERELKVKTHLGYKLTAIVKLAKDDNTSTDIEPTPAPDLTPTIVVEKPIEIEILETGAGFLRVRGEPSSLGEEVARVTPGESYVLLETDEKSGWYKIEYEENKSGWVSNQYAKIVGPTNTLGVSVSPGPKNISPTAPVSVNEP